MALARHLATVARVAVQTRGGHRQEEGMLFVYKNKINAMLFDHQKSRGKTVNMHNIQMARHLAPVPRVAVPPRRGHRAQEGRLIID